MVAKCTMNEKPAAVEIDALPEGGQYVRLHDNAVQVDVPDMDDGEPAKAWECDEVAFKLPQDRAVTKKSVKADFADWWAYGAAWDPNAADPTLADRVDNIEAVMLALLGL